MMKLSFLSPEPDLMATSRKVPEQPTSPQKAFSTNDNVPASVADLQEKIAKAMERNRPSAIQAPLDNNVPARSSFSSLAEAIKNNAEAPTLKSYLINDPTGEVANENEMVIAEDDSEVLELAANDNLPPEVNIFAANDNDAEKATAKDTVETVNFTAEQMSAWQASSVPELQALGDYLAMRGRALEINAEIADMAEKLEAEVANQLAKEESYRSIASFSKSESVSSDPFIAELVKTLLAKAEQRAAKAEEAKAEFEEEEARLKSEIGPHMEIDPKVMMLAKVLDSMRAKNSLLNEGRKKLMPATNDNSRIKAARISQESGEDTAALFIHALTAKAA